MRVSRHGFTLIEVMVSMATMAMIMAIAFAGLGIGLHSWERGGKALDRMDRRAVVERLIHRQLATAYPSIFFRGSASRIEFVSDYSLPDGGGDLRKIEYESEGGQFFYREKLIYGNRFDHNDSAPRESLAAFDRVSFAFLEAGEREAKPSWSDEWPVGKGLPVAVQIHLGSDTFVVSMANHR